MRRSSAKRKGSDRGFTLIELLIVVAIIGIVSAIVIPVYSTMVERSSRSAFAAEARVVYDALKRYYADHASYPPEGLFDRTTMEPLVSEGYLGAGAAKSFLAKQRFGLIEVYVAFDFRGVDRGVGFLLHPEYDPSATAYILDLSTGVDQYDGVYFLHNGQVVPVDQVK